MLSGDTGSLNHVKIKNSDELVGCSYVHDHYYYSYIVLS